MPKHSSATEALDLLAWDTLEKRRRSHRLFLVFKSLNGLIDWNFNFNHFIKTCMTITPVLIITFVNHNQSAHGVSIAMFVMRWMTGALSQTALGTFPIF